MSKLVMVLATLLVGVPGISAAQPEAAGDSANIEVRIAPVRVEDGGSLVVALFNNEDSWLDFERAYAIETLPAGSDTVWVTFEAVPSGQYALEIIHDRNDNGKLDMRWFPYPKPKEGAGVSNNDLRIGKPEYEKALFRVAGETVLLTVEMRY